MGEHQDPCPPVPLGSDFASPTVLGDFYVENHHYLVVCFENRVETLTEQDLNFSLASFTESVVGRFKVDRQHCVIVEAQYCPSKDRKPDATMLLTERELQIVQLVAKGNPNKQIAHRLHISEWTVSTHLRRVFAKLGVDSRAAMVHQCASLLNTLN